jgi:putative ABC transport system permease protein
MNFLESLRQALDSLRFNKLRTFLTMLGIIMGVFSVITIISIGNATQSYLDAEFAKIGANIISFNSADDESPLTLEDMETIKNVVPGIKNIYAMSMGYGEVEVDKEENDLMYYGISSQYKSLSALEMVDGRFVNQIDVKYENSVVVLDETGANKLFGKTDVVGENLEVQNSSNENVKTFKIVGVVKSEEGMFGIASEYMPIVAYIPVTTSMDFGNSTQVDSISIAVDNNDEMSDTGNKAIKALKFKNGSDKKYSAQNTADVQKTLSKVTMVLSSVLLVIAVITLLVGGIGIVNILLVSVTERIREIGIRKALGAKKKDIVFQFLMESIIITGISGIIGIGLGVGLGAIITNLISIPPVVDIKIILLTILGSIGLGIMFGVYPAKKAADLDPIESLRYE